MTRRRSRIKQGAILTFMMVIAVAGWSQSTPTTTTTPQRVALLPVFRFTDITAESGIEFVTTCGETPTTQIVEVNGSGLALIDFDNDGDRDLFVANGATMADPENGPGSRLFENVGAMRFVDVTEQHGIALHRWANGVAVGDYDGDGFDDLFVTCYGRNVLLRNTGGTGFEQVTNAAGLGDDRWSTSAAFGDIDGDGDLDLYVVNYLTFDAANPPGGSQFQDVAVMAGPHGLEAQHDILYENLGDGAFRDITEQSGCRTVRPSFGLGVVMLDFDHDGRIDIFVGNDSMTNFLWHNLGENQFEDVGLQSGVAANSDGGEQATMGIAIADVDGNGFADLFTSNFSSDTNTLHINDGAFFDDRSAQYGLGQLTRPYLGWAAGFYDFDLDADEDLLIVNGHVYPQATMKIMDSEYEQPPLLFERDGRRFERVIADETGDLLAEPHRDRVAVFDDLDGDGDIDIIISELNGPLRVLRNDRPDGNWLIVELQDSGDRIGNHHGLGARITIEHDDVAKQRRWLYSGGYQAANPPSAHFGLPAETAQVTVRIVWPDGMEQTIENVATKQRLIVKR